jgi:hypothetical protein
MYVLGGHIALGQEEYPLTGTIFRQVNNQHGVTRGTSMYQYITGQHGIGIYWNQLLFQGPGAAIHKYSLKVFVKTGPAIAEQGFALLPVKIICYQPVSRDPDPGAVLPFVEVQADPLFGIEIDIPGSFCGIKIFGPKAHNRICALLQVLVAY